ncbi:nicotinate (nicotinamide) nucleotide adenylyltransferase [Acidicapsa ligni]|uniref:nicotinate (nicotinamide) nucleotide adenylyltransferase n=1 Tax=Acidicapsa ligni TaxID=542300 RepID=UPI0021DF4780|nr:nicotinate (nicotinamide) nucleotide adenylyltransferase [Acidicapsa ligni]
MGIHIPGGNRVAFFGGSFDPPHLGHISIARAAQQTLALDQVLFAPVGLQPLKPSGSTASFEDRIAMTELAIADEPNFALSLIDSLIDTPAPTPNYTIDTLAQLRAELNTQFNTKLPGSELFLLLGADSFRNLANWHRASEIPFAATLIVASRPEEDLTTPGNYLPASLTLTSTNDPHHHRIHNSTGQQADLYILPDLNFEISATEIRDQIQDHTKPQLISPKVLNYIQQHHLYQ